MRTFLALCLLLGCAQTSTGGGPEGTDGGGPGADGAGAQEPLPLTERTRILGLIQTYAPILFFHPEERYLPASAEWFLMRAYLFQGDRQVAATPAPDALPTTGDGYYLVLPSSHRGGDLASATVYAHPRVAAGGRFTDIQLWIFYPYNGPATLYLSPLGLAALDVNLSPFGEHHGDWEHVTLRIDNDTHALSAIYLAQHAGGEWIMDPLRTMELDGRRPVVYISRNGHAAYRAPGANLSEAGSQSGLSYGLRNDTARGLRFDCAGSFRLVGDRDVPLTFAGRWGPKVDNAPYLDPVIASVPIVGQAIAGSILGKERYSNGPQSPASRAAWSMDE